MLANIMDKDSAPLSQKDLNPILAAHERFAAYQGGKRAQLTRKGLDGLNLANRVLTEADFAGSSFVGATLYGSNLQRASLYCADLRSANLQAANLTRADMRGCSFRGANLSYAIMDGGDMRAARMMIVNQGKMSVMDRRSGEANTNDPQIPDGVDFTNCSMKHVSFGNAKLDNANFSGAITIFIAVASTIRSSNWISGYSGAIALPQSRNSPFDIFRMFALWTSVTFLRPWRRAYSNA